MPRAGPDCKKLIPHPFQGSLPSSVVSGMIHTMTEEMCPTHGPDKKPYAVTPCRGPQRLCVLADEVGGRWNEGSLRLVCSGRVGHAQFASRWG